MLKEDAVREAIGNPLYRSKEIPFCLTNLALKFVYVNDVFCDTIGYRREELVGKSVRLLLGNKLIKRGWQELFYTLRHKKNDKKRWDVFDKEGNRLSSKIESSQLKIDGKQYTLTITLDTTKESQLEKQLATEKASIQTIIEGANLGYWEFNYQDKVFNTNTLWWEIIGHEPYTHQDIPEFLELITHPDDKHIIPQTVSKMKKGKKEILDCAVRMMTKSGKYRWIQVRGKAVTFDKTGKPKKAVGVHLDITDSKIEEAKVISSERKYRMLTETIPHLIWTTDDTGKPMYMNKHGLQYFGVSESDFESWNWFDHYPEEQAENFEKEWFIASKMQHSVQKTIQIRKHNGVLKWFQVLLYPQQLAKNSDLLWTAIATDIDDRINAEFSLKKANTRLRSLINASPIPVYSVDDQGIVQDFWNPAAERILGWKRNEVMGKFIPHVREEHQEDFEITMRETLEKGQLQKIIKRKKKDGSKIILDINNGCIYDDKGNIEEIMVTLLDITELETQKEQLQESLNEKKTLLQEIHHRVKNNLAIVVSLLQLQVYQSASEQEKIKLTEAQNRVHSIAMVHELLYSSDEFSKVDLKSYYEQLIRIIKGNMRTGQITVQHTLDISLQTLNINQAIPLGLLINELVTNSLKYAFPDPSENDEIRLSIHLIDDWIVLDYEDTGTGFDMSADTFKVGLGFKIMESLLNQLDATYEIDTENRYCLSMKFKEAAPSTLQS